MATARSEDKVVRRRRIGLSIAATVIVLFMIVAALAVTVLLRPQLFVGVPDPVVHGNVDRVSVGDVVPTITGEDFDGHQVTIDPSDGPRVLLFAAHWCDHCKDELDMLATARQTGDLDLGASLIMISTRHIPGVRWPPNKTMNLEGPDSVLVDTNSSLAQLFNVQSVPQWVFLDRHGRIFAELTGEIPLAEIKKTLADAVSPK
ncbi:MAG: redoxin domain-containing protein [Microthrixaceae bacterium]|nr:redoxin domain-containing protein [Microthrixaceae bacterium]